jgi:cell division protein FtsB
MHFLQRKRLEILVGTGCVALLSYFIWQAEMGPRGFNYQKSLEAQGVKLSTDFEKMKQQRKLLEDKVAELRPDSIDPDLLDEMARQSLNFASANQYLVYLKN